MYSNLTWLDHAVTPDRTFTVTENSDGTVTLTPAGTVIQQGTNMSAANFNNLEMGVSDTDLAVHILTLYTRYLEDRTGTSEDDIEEINANILAEITPEEQTVTLTNTAKYPFNSSAAKVSIGTTRNTVNYTVEVIPDSNATNVGEIEVYSKAKNGFYIRYNGSASSVDVTVKIRGGILA
ncbi:MAG: hypothetical protein LUG91_00850 [Ruminococcus sp.]|nr:hypothetical protein [Ruminococcus sp.]MCD7810392.1 hypothetical protein [Ruminococcus sp.]